MLALAIDTGFGTSGAAIYPFHSGDESEVSSVAIEGNGEAVVVGTLSPGSTAFQGLSSLISVSVLTQAGGLDPTFGSNGVVAISPITPVESGAAVTIDASGDIDIVGTVSQGIASAPTSSEFVVIRLLPDGVPDPTFGPNKDGQAIVSFPSVSATANSIFVQPDGKIVVAGEAASVTASGTNSAIAVARLNTDGSLDTTFATGGMETIPVSLGTYASERDNVYFINGAVEPDGDIVLGGDYLAAGGVPPTPPNTVYEPGHSAGVAAVRLNPNGTLDPTFGNEGVAISVQVSGGGYVNSQEPSNGLALQSDGKIVIAAAESSQIAVRLNADGTPDTTFNAAISSSLLSHGYELGAIALQPDGKLVAALPSTTENRGSGLIRLNTDGSVDDGFGTGGLTPATPGPVSAIALQPNGKVVLAGNSTALYNNGMPMTNDAIVSRYIGNAPPADYFGIGESQLAVYDSQTADFDIETPAGTDATAISFGPPGSPFAPFSVDLNGDGRTDLALYDSPDGLLAFRYTGATGNGTVTSTGMAGGIPAPGQYSLYASTSAAIYFPQTATFSNVQVPYNTTSVQFGIPGISLPAVGDFDGSGQTEFGYYVPKTSVFSYMPANGSAAEAIQFGPTGAGFTPAIGDYDGDGKSDMALYSSEYSLFLYQPSSGGPPVAVQFGPPDDGFVAVPGDYDGDGKTDLAIYNAQYGIFIYRPSSGGADRVIQFGPSGGEATAVLTAGVGSNLITPAIHVESVAAVSLASPVVMGSLEIIDQSDATATTPTTTRKATNPPTPLP